MITDARQLKPEYKKLWKLLIDKEMTRSQLRQQTGMSASTMAKLGKGEDVSMGLMRRICELLDCNIGDVMEFVTETEKKSNGLAQTISERGQNGTAR